MIRRVRRAARSTAGQSLTSEAAASWVATQLRAVCADTLRWPSHEGAVRRRVGQLAAGVYPELLRRGYEIPLSVVVDLAELYRLGPKFLFVRPAGWPVPPELAVQYCQVLNELARGGRLHSIIKAVRAAAQHWARLSKRGIASLPHPGPGENGESRGLATFVSLVADAMLRNAGVILEPQIPPAIRKELLAGVVPPAGESPSIDRRSARFLESFLGRVMLSGRDNGRARPFTAALCESGAVLLTLAGFYAPAGAEGLDLPVLQASLDYAPLQLTADEARRYQRFRQSLIPREDLRSRSPECGNHGITRKGTLFSALRSYLARDEFVDLMYLKKLLYFNRYAFRQEPHRVLLLWVIDRGAGMHALTPVGLRRDAVARRLAAYLIEDAARYFADVPAMTLHLGVAAHGVEGGAARVWCVAPPESELRRAPSAASGRGGRGEVWLPKLEGFLTQFYMREPRWPVPRQRRRREGGATPAASHTAAHRSRRPPDYWRDQPYGQALDCLMREVNRAAAAQSVDTASRLFDACCVTLVGPGSALPIEPGAQDGEILSFLRRFSAQPALEYIICGERGVRWRAWPRRSGGPAAGEEPGEEAYDLRAPHESGIRHAVWRDLLARLHTLK